MLLGRDAETALVDDLLATARTGQSSALIVLGEPGVGKSALLEYAASEARDMHVLRARGMESESELAFSGLSDLLRPLLPALPRIPAPQAAALQAALGLARGAPLRLEAVGERRDHGPLRGPQRLAHSRGLFASRTDARWPRSSLRRIPPADDGPPASARGRTRDRRRGQGKPAGAARDPGASYARTARRSRAATRPPPRRRSALGGIPSQ